MEHHPHHRVSRRSFLKSGFLSGVLIANPFGIMANLFPKSAFAAQSATVPFFVFDLDGGAALPGHFVPLSSSYEYLKGYNSVRGRNTSEARSVDMQFGTPMFVGPEYEIHAALLRICSKEALEKLRFITICNQSISDKPFNFLSAIQLVNRVGKASVFKTGLGTFDTLSGGNSQAFGETESGKPLLIKNVQDIIAQVKPSGPLASLSDTEVNNLGSLSAELAELQAKTLFAKAGRSESVVNAYQRNATNLRERIKVDPSESADVRTVFQNDSSSVLAGIAFNVLNGNATAGVYRIENFDYHAPRKLEGKEGVKDKDRQFGEALAKTIQLAHVLRKPMFAQIVTDGGCVAGSGDTYWATDDNSKSMTVLACYHTDGPREMVGKHFQIGNYTYSADKDSVGVDTSTFMGTSPEIVAQISYLNYLAFSGSKPFENGLAYVDSTLAKELTKYVRFKI